jgi:Protein of unknown function (DUF3752)
VPCEDCLATPRPQLKMGRADGDRGNEEDDDGSSFSSSLDDGDNNDNHDNDRRERKRSSKKHKKKRERHEEYSSKKKKSKKRRSSRKREHSDGSESSNSDDDDSDDEERTKKRHKKDNKRQRKKKDTYKSSREEKKSSKKQHKSKSRGRRRNDDDHSDNDDHDDNNNKSSASDEAFARNHALANALLQLLDSHPALITDLPIMLIRLAGGTSFDLSQMTDPTASHGIAAVFACLEPYGVQQDAKSSAWMWKGPQSQQQGGSKNDLVLVRVVRALLDQIGITNDAVEAFESEGLKRQQAALTAPTTTTQNKVATATAAASSSAASASSGSSNQKDDPIIGQVQQMFTNFDENAGLGKELAVLCHMILDGESVALDGLPDERLRKALERLFESCGLEKCEMENGSDDDEEQDDDDGDKKKETPSMGYGLPENDAGNPKETTARVRLESILTACQQQTQSDIGARRRVLGPSLPPAGYEQQEEESDEEGPQLTADATAARPETADMVRAQAARRARELRAVNAGLSIKDIAAIEEGGGREEWMIVPGQYDFLDCIKSAPIRNRTFQGGSKHDKDKQQHNEGPIDPAVQAEMNAILQAHHDSRGPSLFEEHRAAKAAAEAEKKKSGKSNNWKWSRDRDLDEGRRVDKDALNMVMGGAATVLQSKFQGGFGR